MNDLSLYKIEDLVEKQITSKSTENILNIFIAAINDWPTEILSSDVFITKIEELISKETSKKNIQEFLRNIDFSKHAWEGESLTQILEVFSAFPESNNLKEILRELKITLENEVG